MVSVTSIVGATSATGIVLSIGLLLAANPSAFDQAFCTCTDGDACWPSPSQWQELNTSVGGRLITPVPPASVCHDPNFDEAQCGVVRDEWIWPEIHESWPGGVQSPYWQNSSCDPFTPREVLCTLGNSVSYAIDVTGADDVIRGLSFARKHALRLAIKNTGHDYMGRSTAKGGLALWTHKLRKLEVLNNFTSQAYSGPAIRMGAGVRGLEAYAAAEAHGLRVAGGFCPSVGILGGYTQGGGHGPMSSQYGLGADQALEWEVITPTGKHVVATPQQNSDLYWALSGGGPGTYGVVLSLTVRAHQDGPVGGASLAFSTTDVDKDDFWAFFETWQDLLPSLTAAGGTAGYAVLKDAFFIAPITLPGWSKTRVSDFISPLIQRLDQTGVQYALDVSSSPTFLDHYSKYGGPLPRGPYTIHHLFGGRMIPRTTVEQNSTALANALRSVIEDTDVFMGFVALDVSQTASRKAVADNAVLPAWRDALITVLVQSTWDFDAPRSDGQRRADEITNVVVPKLAALTPDSGAYLNEADFQHGDWKHDFFGANYDRLKAIKNRYDPEGLLYGHASVGSEAWSLDGDGRLCKGLAEGVRSPGLVRATLLRGWGARNSGALRERIERGLRAGAFRLGVFLQSVGEPL
ncbi:long-chain-fatty-acid-CoA ligase [Colletotrichum sojae]|uniref:Long-chain-fatty-acid-CoA ligase n=1 Tax=Colletotrichum sojae TaxID=2175907 RepID=A0A8H6IMY0_9PEZI|nr:long-chain-fatty-acid-CoA ligase [Colletotrichum sojae]